MKFNVGDDPRRYWRLKAPRPAPPSDGKVLVQRLPFSRLISVTHADGRIDRTIWDGTPENRVWAWNQGIPRDKVDQVIDYVWNFGKCYVNVNPDEAD